MADDKISLVETHGYLDHGGGLYATDSRQGMRLIEHALKEG